MKNLTNFREVNDYLLNLVPKKSIKKRLYTLHNMHKMMEALGEVQNSYKTIHVAGTSGKSSTSYFIASLLKESCIKTGLSVSPHIKEVNERVQIDLVPLPERKFAGYLSELRNMINRNKITPTYFELLVALAFWIFSKEKVDYAVVEVGLGGLLDGTNVIDREDKISVITDIGFDHTEILGNKIEEIASQKAGIINPNSDVFMLKQDKIVNDIVRQICDTKKARLTIIEPQIQKELNFLPKFQQRNFFLAKEVFNFIAKRDHLNSLNRTKIIQSASVDIPAPKEVKIISLDIFFIIDRLPVSVLFLF